MYNNKLLANNLFLFLYIFTAFTDLYLYNQIKLVYVFVACSIIPLFLKKIKIDKEFLFLLLWYISYFFAIGHIASISDFIVVAIGQLALFIIYLFFTNIKTIKSFIRIYKLIEWSLCILVLIGTVQLISFYVFGSTWGISHLNHGVGLPRMRGLSAEPDWYGLICMISALMLIVNVVTKTYLRSPTFDKVMTFISCAMLLLSLTRAAWLGFLCGLIFILTINDLQGKKIKRRFWHYVIRSIPIIFAVLILISLSNSNAIVKLLTRMNIRSWNTNDGGAAGTRSASISIMLYYFLQHPFTGNGVGGMNYVSSNQSLLDSLGYNYSINAGRGNANIVITNLYDVGIIGTFFLCVYFGYHLVKIVKIYRKTDCPYMLSLIMITIGLLVDFQFNNGLRLAYVWIILGLAISLCGILKKES